MSWSTRFLAEARSGNWTAGEAAAARREVEQFGELLDRIADDADIAAGRAPGLVEVMGTPVPAPSPAEVLERFDAIDRALVAARASVADTRARYVASVVDDAGSVRKAAVLLEVGHTAVQNAVNRARGLAS